MKKNNLHRHLVESKKRIFAYDQVLNEAERTFRELNSRNMQATLIQIEDFFDSNNLYAFNNWFEGVIWDGPDVDRYWVEITLQYPYTLMPEPTAMNRFGEMGVKYKFVDTVIKKAIDVKNPDDLDPVTRKPKEEDEHIWLVTLKIPRHLIDDPMPNDTEEVDTVQNIEASKEAEDASAEAPVDEEMDDMDSDDTGGDDLRGDDLEL